VVLDVERAGRLQLVAAPERDELRVQPLRGVALPLSCSAARYSWRMKAGRACARAARSTRAGSPPTAWQNPDDIIVQAFFFLLTMALNLAIAQLNFVVGDMPATRKKIVDAARQAHAQGARLLLTPELSIAATRRRTCSCVPRSPKPVMMP
jgi:hypothetical protein